MLRKDLAASPLNMTFDPIAVSLLGVVALLIALKMLLRAWLSRPTESFVWAPYRRIRFLHDLSVLPAADPDARIMINSQGERGEPIPQSWAGVYRILVMGGSTAECIALDQPHTWPEVIREKLSTSENLSRLGVQAVHVGNIGKSLLPIAAQIQILQTLAPRYAGLDLLICMVGFSDLVAWLEEGAPAGAGAKDVSIERIFERSPANLGWGWRRLAITRALRTLYQRVFKPEQVLDTYTKRIVARRQRRAAAVLTDHMSVNSAAMMAKFEADLAAYLQLAKSVAKRVIIVRQPWLDPNLSKLADQARWMGSIAGSADAQGQGRYLTSPAMSVLLEQVDRITQAVALKQKVESIGVKDLIPADLDHYVDDVHLAIKGARIVGETAADVILKGHQAAKLPA